MATLVHLVREDPLICSYCGWSLMTEIEMVLSKLSLSIRGVPIAK